MQNREDILDYIIMLKGMYFIARAENVPMFTIFVRLRGELS